MKDDKTILKGLYCCVEYLCGECPYKDLMHDEYILRCTHTLLVDLYKMLNKKSEENKNGST